MYQWQDGDALNETNLNNAQTKLKEVIDEEIGTLEELNTTDKTNLVNAINEVNKKNVVTTQDFTSENFIVNVAGRTTQEFNVAKDGYIPLGILFIDTHNDLDVSKFSSFNNKAYVTVKNYTSKSITASIIIRILYVKNET